MVKTHLNSEKEKIAKHVEFYCSLQGILAVARLFDLNFMDEQNFLILCLVLQVLDMGIILHPGSYLREFWNIMDAIVVICAAVSLGFEIR